MNSILRSSLLRSSVRISEGLIVSRYAPRKILANNCFLTSHTTSAVLSQLRLYSDSNVERQKLPELMSFPHVVWPSIIKFIKNWIFANFIIRPYLEQDFNMSEFVEASKQAVQVISAALQRGDYNSLEGLVVKEAIKELKESVGKMTMKERQMLAINKEDIFYAVPYQIGVMFDDSEKRWVEITMCYHVMLGFKSMKENNELPPVSLGLKPEYEDKLFILNYRFIREFTKGVEDSWWVNIVNHFQPHLLKDE